MLEEATNAHVEPDTHSHAVHSLAIHRVPCPYTSCYTRHYRVGIALQPTVACSDTKTAWLTLRQAASRELVCRDVVPMNRVAVACPHSGHANQAASYLHVSTTIVRVRPLLITIYAC